MSSLTPIEVKKLEDWAQALDKEQSFVVAMNLSDETIWKAMMHNISLLTIVINVICMTWFHTEWTRCTVTRMMSGC